VHGYRFGGVDLAFGGAACLRIERDAKTRIVLPELV